MYVLVAREASNFLAYIRSDPLPSCLCFEHLAVTDSLAIRVATVLILIPFSVQSKICKKIQAL